jgi:hypothetical protein
VPFSDLAATGYRAGLDRTSGQMARFTVFRMKKAQKNFGSMSDSRTSSAQQSALISM